MSLLRALKNRLRPFLMPSTWFTAQFDIEMITNHETLALHGEAERKHVKQVFWAHVKASVPHWGGDSIARFCARGGGFAWFPHQNHLLAADRLSTQMSGRCLGSRVHRFIEWGRGARGGGGHCSRCSSPARHLWTSPNGHHCKSCSSQLSPASP